MRDESETTGSGQRLRQATQINRFTARCASVLILNEEHLCPANRAVVTHTIHGAVDADALNTIHCLAVNGTLHTAR